MSNEPVKLEVDCSVGPYSLHHHHHHHHITTHQNLHLKHHHNPHLDHNHLTDDRSPPHISDEVASNEEEEVEDDYNDRDDLIENKEQSSHFQCNHTPLNGLTKLVTQSQIDHLDDVLVDCDRKQLTQLENVVCRSEKDEYELSSIRQTKSGSPKSTTSSTSSDSDISESDGDEDSEEEDDDGDEDEEEDSEVDDDDEDDDEYDEDEIDDDIVDPVGNQINGHLHSATGNNNEYDCSVTNMTCYDRVNNNQESVSDEDVSFDSELGEATQIQNNSTSDLLDGERMLEVTRKLVRSTERDPDRDLRKQVLLRTAIRRLPLYLDYNHYSETPDQSFQLHNNTLDGNNSSVACLSPTQYYEHSHLNHNMESQPKSYYHSVQPNAIQMSTTSLRMLDLNDDSDSEQAITLDSKHQHDHNYDNHVDHSRNISQTSLEQQHEYTTHRIYNHYTPLDGQSTLEENNAPIHEHNDQGAIHDFSQYDSNRDSNVGMIVRHSTLENLYQSTETSDMNDDLKAIERPPVFHDANDYSRLTLEQNSVDDELDDKTQNYDNVFRITESQVDMFHNLTKDDSNNNSNNNDHLFRQNHDCNSNQTDTTAFYNIDATQENLLHLEKPARPEAITTNSALIDSCANETLEALEGYQSAISEGSSSNSSQSSTASDDSVNSTSSQSNDSVGDLSGISILETSLNTSDEYRFNNSHDSGVVLFGRKSNKRSSSTIAMDEDMEIDHLTDLTSSNQFNSSNSLTTSNQCKRMKKRELID